MNNIEKYLKEYSEQYALEINDVRILMPFVEYVNKQQPQPLTDEELSKLASDMFDKGDIDNTTSFKLGYKHAINHNRYEWVRCEDRLPEVDNNFGESDYVLCKDDNKPPFVGYYNHNLNRWIVAHHHASSEAADVTHWQPLPTKPNTITNDNTRNK